MSSPSILTFFTALPVTKSLPVLGSTAALRAVLICCSVRLMKTPGWGWHIREYPSNFVQYSVTGLACSALPAGSAANPPPGGRIALSGSAIIAQFAKHGAPRSLAVKLRFIFQPALAHAAQNPRHLRPALCQWRHSPRPPGRVHPDRHL